MSVAMLAIDEWAGENCSTVVLYFPGGAGAGPRETAGLVVGDSPHAQASGDEGLVLRATGQPRRRDRLRRRLRRPVRPPDGTPVDPAVGDGAGHALCHP